MTEEGARPARGAASRSDSGLLELNEAAEPEAIERLLACCGSRRWARAMVGRRPFADPDALAAAADEVWWELDPEDWLEAFAAHPRIGEREEAGERADGGERSGSLTGGGALTGAEDAEGRSAAWSRSEQAGARGAGEETLRALDEGNRRYEERFGHVFLIRAAGRSAGDMLAALTERMSNDPEAELRVAAAQQAEITRLRLAALVDGN